jgi:hypothetical protein
VGVELRHQLPVGGAGTAASFGVAVVERGPQVSKIRFEPGGAPDRFAECFGQPVLQLTDLSGQSLATVLAVGQVSMQ